MGTPGKLSSCEEQVAGERTPPAVVERPADHDPVAAQLWPPVHFYRANHAKIVEKLRPIREIDAVGIFGTEPQHPAPPVAVYLRGHLIVVPLKEEYFGHEEEPTEQ
jgi:hypothetical protein